MSDPVLAKLDELIAAVRSSAVPDKFIDARGVAELLSFSYNYTKSDIVHAHDFPAPARFNGEGDPRWLRSEVLEWFKRQRQRRRRATALMSGA